MAEYELPTVERRKLLLRTCRSAPRPQLMIGIVSTYGNVMEAVTIEAGDVLGLCRGAGKVARAAFELFNEEALARKIEAGERWKAALARNPWLNESPEQLQRRGLV